MALDDLTRLVGLFVVAINFASAFSIISQIRLTFHRKNTVGLSRLPWAMSTTNAAAGMVYSLLIADLVFFLANLAWTCVNATMIALLLYYSRSSNSTTGAG
jgi:hypothetical protein